MRQQLALAREFVRRLHVKQVQPTGWIDGSTIVNGKIQAPVNNKRVKSASSKMSSSENISAVIQPRDLHTGPIVHVDVALLTEVLTNLQDLSIIYG